MMGPEPRSLSWRVNGLRLAGLSWGDTAASPLLALHGWLDNAASFSLLGPLLSDFHVVAPDLTGHGCSDHRSADATYQIWDDLPEIIGVADALGWRRFGLIGHSRGAIIASLLAASAPGRVSRLVLLDALAPKPVPEQAFARQLRRFLQDKARLQAHDHRVYPTVEAAMQTRRERGLSEHAHAARLLVERNLRGCEGGFTWTTDPRLQGASAVKLTAGQIQAVWEALEMPALLLQAAGGHGGCSWMAEMVAMAGQCVRAMEVGSVDGGHHFHLEPAVEEVARRIARFLQGADGQGLT
jgi:pimeloyl-ACP methyl ester carboxylesterase